MNAANFWSAQRRHGRDAPAVRSRRDYLLADRPAGKPATPIWRWVTLAFSLALGFVSPCLAGTQQIAGTITDALGRPVAEVNVELRNGNGSAIARATTDPAGRFKIAPAKPGVYSLEVVKAGFKPATKIVVFPRSAGEPVSMTLETETALTLPVQGSLIRAQNGVSTT
ncbi:MAG: carboxypeptidase-like regulatory domain-containing protein, partial [Candidatus Binataceae bacterium]